MKYENKVPTSLECTIDLRMLVKRKCIDMICVFSDVDIKTLNIFSHTKNTILIIKLGRGSASIEGKL